MNYERERRIAIATVTRACQLSRNIRATLVTADSMAKKDKSPVTVADFGAQAIVSFDLAAAFPADPLVGEEHASDLTDKATAAIRASVVRSVQTVYPQLDEAAILSAISRGSHDGGNQGRFWTLDPIDGTKGFLRGEQYAVALALIEDGIPVLGVLGCPNLPVQCGGIGAVNKTKALSAEGAKGTNVPGCLFVAVRGQGAYMLPLDSMNEAESSSLNTAIQEFPIRVNDVADAAAAVFCESVESGHSAHDHSARVAQLLGVTAPPYRIDSQCKYAAVARGDASIYLRLPTRADYEEKIWDHAAGWAVITEAGGRVTDVAGRPLDFSLGRTLRHNKGVVATSGQIHDAVITAVKNVLGL
ncbi:MAG: 3'(2'),5'-bisphosphate nucleotidase [Phycisphaerae bacterium]|nr:3'(2'),5'-bisphosphate nucleotidase [Phycisphaerae bacterium]